MDRPIRSCDVCSIEDDHPRHEILLDEGGSETRHMDCCRGLGCSICAEVTSGGEDLRGDDLLQFLQTRST